MRIIPENYIQKSVGALPVNQAHFLDPLYSPGTDFISLNNSWLSDLILRDLDGEDITGRVHIYEQSHLALGKQLDTCLPE